MTMGRRKPPADAPDETMPVSAEDPRYGLSEDLQELEIIVVHDPILTNNGGIDVIANIARFLDAPLYTLRQTSSPEPLEDVEVREIEPGTPRLANAMRRRSLGRLLELSTVLAYQNWKPPRSADVVVTTGTRAQHVIQHPEQHRIHFFNTPARWLWDLSHGQWDDRNRIVRWAMRRYAAALRNLDVTSTHRLDHLIANSELVRDRIDAYYGRDADVAYCPSDTFAFHHAESEGYFVMVNRIVPEKRVKLVVEAFTEVDVPLKIAGEPAETATDYAAECRRVAGDNVEFLGWVDEEAKVDLLARAEALVFAGEHEDFGMPPVEAMASGKPVVGVNEGFTRRQLVDGETGVLFEPSKPDLLEAIEAVSRLDWDPETIQEASRRYDVRAVRKRWHTILSDTITSGMS